MICSDYDKHKGVADKVKQSYAVTAIKIALKKNKFSINLLKIILLFLEISRSKFK